MATFEGNLHFFSRDTFPEAYDKENRMVVHHELATRTTFTYDGDGLKRSERSGASITTLLWDGREYLGEVS